MKYIFTYLVIFICSTYVLGQKPDKNAYEDCIRAKNDFQKQIATLKAELEKKNGSGSGNSVRNPNPSPCAGQIATINDLNKQIRKLTSLLNNIKKLHAIDATNLMAVQAANLQMAAQIQALQAQIAQLEQDTSNLAQALRDMTDLMNDYLTLYSEEAKAKAKAALDFQTQLIKETMTLHTRSRVGGLGATRGVELDASNKAGVFASRSQRKEPIYLSFKSHVAGAPPITNTTYTVKKAGSVLDGAQQIGFRGDSDIRLPDALYKQLQGNIQYSVTVEYEVNGEKRSVDYYFRVD